jgi:hypothetical protein
MESRKGTGHPSIVNVERTLLSAAFEVVVALEFGPKVGAGHNVEAVRERDSHS